MIETKIIAAIGVASSFAIGTISPETSYGMAIGLGTALSVLLAPPRSRMEGTVNVLAGLGCGYLFHGVGTALAPPLSQHDGIRLAGLMLALFAGVGLRGLFVLGREWQADPGALVKRLGAIWNAITGKGAGQ